MPVVSGIGLLCKIMTHKTLKNIPVISKYHLLLLSLLIFMKCKVNFPMNIASLMHLVTLISDKMCLQ